MKNKIKTILKFELLGIFLLTIVAFSSFYYSQSLPDNFYSISSNTEGVGFLSYYLTTALVAIGEFSGPWVFIPFVIFSLFYSFQYSRREYLLDTLNLFTLTFACLFIFVLLVPEAVGRGLNYYLNTYLSTFTLVTSALLFSFAFFAGSFRESFKQSVFDFVHYLSLLPGILFRGAVRINPVSVFKSGQSFIDKLNKTGRLLVGQILKGKADTDSMGKDKKPSSSSPVILGHDESTETEVPRLAREELSRSTAFSQSLQSDQAREIPVTEIREEKVTINDNEELTPRKTNVSEIVSAEQVERENQYYNLVDRMPHFQKSDKTNTAPSDDYFGDIVTRIEEKLGEFNIDGKIINILKGPVVDTFELELGPGVKVSKVNSAEDDLSLALYGAPVRIVYPMVGKTTVGIEVPRNPRDVIYLDEVIQSQEFQKSNHRLPIAMGKNAFGETSVVDLASMPHMLIAGATGAGKSVFINTLLVSLLIKKSPRQMKLILIDPKQLELALYHQLPHLILPVVTDAKRAAISLIWACQEMDKRYSILKEMGVRGIEGFNEKIQRATPEQLAAIHQYYDNADEDGYELPYIVIIIDEFADLILTKAGKEIETNVSRLAAKARAAGIHLVLATQRPSVDVITGVIKSNFPTRVSFRVTGVNDSKTILDGKGAEKLLGKGDMLYKHGTSKIRLHSSYVDEVDVEHLVTQLSSLEPQFNESALDFIENGGEIQDDPYSYPSTQSLGQDGQNQKDDRFDEALQVVLEHGEASASMLQRRLRVGYNRASNLIDELESLGVIGPAQGSKPRKVLGPPSGP